MYNVQSSKTGLTAKRWALAGLLFGPTIYPLFRSRQKIKLLRARGSVTVYSGHKQKRSLSLGF
jgi:hypothetical protein